MVFYNQRIFIILVAIVEIVLLFFSPLAAVCLLTLLLYTDNIDYVNNVLHYKLLVFYIFMCSAVLGLINITKVPENDLIWYMEHFHESGTTNLLNFMKYSLSTASSGAWKEPAYSLLVWVANPICRDNGAAFKFMITLLNYLLLNYSVLLFAKRFELPTKCVIISVVAMSFIPYIFTMSLHLIRQFSANSLLIFIAVRVCFYQRKDYILLAMMPLIHSTSFLFIPLLLFSAYDKHIKDAKFWYLVLLIGLLGLQFFSGFIESSLEQESLLTYAAHRAATGSVDQWNSLSPIKVATVVIFALAAIYVEFFSSFSNEEGNKRFMNLILLLASFIILNLQQQLFAMRFYFYLLPFTPFLLMYLLSMQPKLKAFSPIVMGVIMFLFINYVEHGTFTYELDHHVILTPITGFSEPTYIL